MGDPWLSLERSSKEKWTHGAIEMMGRSSLVVAVAVMLTVGACGNSTATVTPAPAGNTANPAANTQAPAGNTATPAANTQASAGGACAYKFAVITHGDNGGFWSVVYKGAKDAAADLGCTLTEVYGSQQQGQAQPDDNAENAQIQDAINAKVNGIAVSDHNPSLMNPTIASAVAAGIPVVLINAGCDNADIAASTAMTCVGQPETLAGEQSGARFKAENASNVLCVIHQSGQNLLDRCNGIAQALGVGATCSTGAPPASGPGCTEFTLTVPNAASNPAPSGQQIVAYLQAHPQINAVMTLNNAIAQGLATALPSGSTIKQATFDVNAWGLTAVQSGQLDFIVDQQQYLQGYLPIEFLYLYNQKYGASVGGGTTVPTGPLLVDKTNASKVTAAVTAGDQ
jgi:simple sugar transport system substrate-binding protein